MKNLDAIYAEFNFKQTNYQGETSGEFDGILYLEDNKYKLKMPGTVIYSNGKTLWQYLVDLNEVTITNAREDDNSVLSDPGQIFTGYEKNFKYKFKEEYLKNGHTVHVVDLFPKDLDNSEYSRIRLDIQKDGLRLEAAKYFGKNGIQYHINILDFKAMDNMKKGFFKFDKSEHPGVEINDMR